MKSYKMFQLEKELAEIEGWLKSRENAMLGNTASEKVRAEWREHLAMLENVGAKIVKLEKKRK